MAGNAQGALRAAARRIGVTHEEYLYRRSVGEKWCTGCKEWHPTDRFVPDLARGDGLSAMCREARKALYEAHYVSRATGVPPGPPPASPRDGDKRQARARVNVLVRTGRLPKPTELPCFYCGKRWRKGAKRHEYHHHRGYGSASHADVVAVCTSCHGTVR